MGVVLAVALGAVTGPFPASLGDGASGDPELGSALADAAGPGRVGLAAAVVTPDGARTAAVGDDGNGDPLTADTPMEVGSVTKTFTGAALASPVDTLIGILAPLLAGASLLVAARGGVRRRGPVRRPQVVGSAAGSLFLFAIAVAYGATTWLVAPFWLAGCALAGAGGAVAVTSWASMDPDRGPVGRLRWAAAHTRSSARRNGESTVRARTACAGRTRPPRRRPGCGDRPRSAARFRRRHRAWRPGTVTASAGLPRAAAPGPAAAR